MKPQLLPPLGPQGRIELHKNGSVLRKKEAYPDMNIAAIEVIINTVNRSRHY